MGPYRLKVLGRYALPEAALQGSFPKSRTPAIGGAAEVGPSARFSPSGIDGNLALAGLNYSNELPFRHLQTTGNATTLGDMTCLLYTSDAADE